MRILESSTSSAMTSRDDCPGKSPVQGGTQAGLKNGLYGDFAALMNSGALGNPCTALRSASNVAT
jgi:hypothetical protein